MRHRPETDDKDVVGSAESENTLEAAFASYMRTEQKPVARLVLIGFVLLVAVLLTVGWMADAFD